MYTRQCSPTTCCGWFAYCQPDTRHRAGASSSERFSGTLDGSLCLDRPAYRAFCVHLTVKTANRVPRAPMITFPPLDPWSTHALYTPHTIARRYASLKSEFTGQELTKPAVAARPGCPCDEQLGIGGRADPCL